MHTFDLNDRLNWWSAIVEKVRDVEELTIGLEIRPEYGPSCRARFYTGNIETPNQIGA
jgi:hypothetical protein